MKCRNGRKWNQRNSYSGGQKGVSPSEYAGFSLFLRNPFFNPIGTQKDCEDFWRPHFPAWKEERISLELIFYGLLAGLIASLLSDPRAGGEL